MTPSPQTPQNQLIFQSALLPIAFTMAGVLARRLGRRDGDDAPRRNDWAVATTVLLMSLGKVAGDLLDALSQGANGVSLMYWLIGFVLLALFSIDQDRYSSWVLEENKPTRLKRIWGGIVFPDTVAVLVFLAYQYMKLKKAAP